MVTDDQGPMCSNIQISLPLHCYSLCLLWQHKSSPGQALMIGYLQFWVPTKKHLCIWNQKYQLVWYGALALMSRLYTVWVCATVFSIYPPKIPKALNTFVMRLKSPPQKMLTIDSITLMGLILSHEYKDIIEVVLVLVSYLF